MHKTLLVDSKETADQCNVCKCMAPDQLPAVPWPCLLSGKNAGILTLGSENLAQVFVMSHLLCREKRLWNEKTQMQMAQAMLGEKP